MIVFRRFIIYFLCLVTLCCQVWSSDLDCLFFKVGQANFVLLTKGCNALVVDCGVGSGYGPSQEKGVFKSKNEYYYDIKKALHNVQTLGIVVTHTHVDHYGSINGFENFIKQINRERIRLKTSNIIITQEINDNFLGDGTAITVFRPIDDDLLNPADQHQINMIFKITYAGKSIILPGDAGGTLFAYWAHFHKEYFKKIFENAVVLLLPHHGSWEGGEQLWLKAFLENGMKKQISIISSDPNKDNYLPRSDYIEKILKLHSQDSNYHDFMFSSLIEKKETIGTQESLEETQEFGLLNISQSHILQSQGYKITSGSISNNLFLTASAKSTYYKVTILDAGSVSLYDGEIQLFTTQVGQ